MWKKIMTACLAAAVLLCSSAPAFAVAPTLNSEAACVMDADTGELLYMSNAEQQYPMASITKVMTALVVLENCEDLTKKTVVTQEVLDTVDPESTRVGFEAGEELTYDELMSCMLVDSANDAANILAAAVGGDLASFVELMNKKAEELGCTHTHFINPNGLDEDGHYTTAHDMAVITRAANVHPEFAKYSSQLEYELPADNVISAGWKVKTRVNMINPAEETYDARVYAAKTGWTTLATNTFIACGKTEKGANVIVTVLHCPVKSGIFMDTTALLDYVDTAYTPVTVTAAEYTEAAQAAAEEQGFTLDTAALKDFTLRLPTGMTAADLTYNCISSTDGVDLAIGIAEESLPKYTETTGMTGAETIMELPVTLASSADDSEDNGSAVSLINRVEDMPQTAQSGMMAALCVIGAGVLILVLVIILAIVHAVRGRNGKSGETAEQDMALTAKPEEPTAEAQPTIWEPEEKAVEPETEQAEAPEQLQTEPETEETNSEE